MVKSVISSVFTASTMVLPPGTCRRKEEVDPPPDRGAEKDILIERKNCFSGSGSKEMPAIVTLNRR